MPTSVLAKGSSIKTRSPLFRLRNKKGGVDIDLIVPDIIRVDILGKQDEISVGLCSYGVDGPLRIVKASPGSGAVKYLKAKIVWIEYRIGGACGLHVNV